jgi:O-antigen/teichoic acid export membrane protein
MRKLFVKNLIILQGLNLVIKPVWLLLIDRMAQNMLGEAIYGEYYIILNLVLVSNILLDIGIQNFNNTSVASDHGFFKANFQSIIGAKLLLSVVYFILVGGIGYASGMQVNLLVILLFNQVLTSFVLYLRSNINGLHFYQVDSLLSVSDKFFGIVLCLAFFYASRISITYFALAQLFATVATLLIAIFLNIRYYRAIPENSMDRVGTITGLLKKSIPYALLFALMGLYTKGDVLMMKWLLPDADIQCGLYAQSVRLLDAANMFAMLFAGLLLPMFARMLAANNDVRPLANMAGTLLALVSISVSLAAILMGEPIMDMMYDYTGHEELLLSTGIFRNIMLCFVPMSLIYVFSTLLTAQRDIRYMNIFAIAALIVNIVLNIFLVPRYQAFGASLGSLATQSVFAILCILRCVRLFSFRMAWSMILRYLGFIICLIGVYFVVKSLGNIWLVLCVYGLSALVLSGLLKIIDVRKIVQTFKVGKQ